MADTEERSLVSPLSDPQGYTDCGPIQSVIDEASPLLGSSRDIKSYKRRWYVVLVFSYAALLQAAVWNCFGPIAQSAEAVFGWTDAEIGMLNNWGNIVYIVFMVPVAWLMDVKGLRTSMLLCAVLIVLATAMRCITSEPVPATWLINIAAILNGVAGTVSFAGPSLVSATWFPPHQRATATAVSTVLGYMGISGGFIIGPLLVPEPDQDTNTTDTRLQNCSRDDADQSWNITNAIDVSAERDGLMLLMYVECAASVLLLLLVVVYFPARPPSPPSITASIERTGYLQGVKGLLTHKRFLLILMAYGTPTGVFAAFGAVLDVNLEDVNISQNQAGWMGFYATMGGSVAALLMSRLADMFMRRMKVMLLLLFVLATSATVWFVLLRLAFIPFSMVSLYISYILIGVFINGSVPLFYELGCEASYPIAEGVTTGMLTLVNSLTGTVFLSILQIPDIGVTWMNWCLLGTVITAIPLLVVFKEGYTRTNIDMQKEFSSR
ncbi:solute carrier family 49 member 4 homolog isoform X1 [Haliotis rufescens]|uniref:solute carrier family 49 member 4 homolog isoform X1 n=1 Tax=Haliotis rufescens TaxID=6454 RepID=UPI00201F47EA|nr:solute carrier family 49 member 4 homolog isoform X1 [Haliotis rufescens]